MEIEKLQTILLEKYRISVCLLNDNYLNKGDARLGISFKSPAPGLWLTILSGAVLPEHIKQSHVLAVWIWRWGEHNIEISDIALWG